MTEMGRIRDLLRRAFEGGAWHGPAVREVLDGVTAGRAAARPVSGAHSIWEILLHMIAWKREVTRRLTGHGPRTLPAEEDWPPVADRDPRAWTAALAALEEAHTRLDAALARLDDRALDQPLGGASGATWTIYLTLHGVIQHDLYHAGQIAVLKKGE